MEILCLEESMSNERERERERERDQICGEKKLIKYKMQMSSNHVIKYTRLL